MFQLQCFNNGKKGYGSLCIIRLVVIRLTHVAALLLHKLVFSVENKPSYDYETKPTRDVCVTSVGPL